MDRPLFDKNGFALSKTFGKSMRPLIWGGQHCVVVVPLSGEPEIGDMLMFRQTISDGKERNVVHRLVAVRRDGAETIYITRGDNCYVAEEVRRDEIIGRVAEVHRVSGFRPWHIIPSRQFAVTDKAYRRYVRIWAATWPVRRVYYLMRAHVRGLRVRLGSIMRRSPKQYE